MSSSEILSQKNTSATSKQRRDYTTQDKVPYRSSRCSVQELRTPTKLQINTNILDLQTGELSAEGKLVVGLNALSYLRHCFLLRYVHPYFIRSPLVFSKLQVPCLPPWPWLQFFRRRKFRDFEPNSCLYSMQTSSGVKRALVPLPKELLNFLVAPPGDFMISMESQLHFETLHRLGVCFFLYARHVGQTFLYNQWKYLSTLDWYFCQTKYLLGYFKFLQIFTSLTTSTENQIS